MTIMNDKTKVLVLSFFMIFLVNSRTFAQIHSTNGREGGEILLLKLLASENSTERVLAIKLLQGLANRKGLPTEFIPVLVHVSDTDKDSLVAQTAIAVLVTAANSDTAMLKSIPPRITIVIQNDNQSRVANELASSLQLLGFLTDIELSVARFDNKSTDLMTTYLWDEPEGKELTKILKERGLDVHHTISIAGVLGDYPYLAKTRPRHYELWLASTLSSSKKP